MQPLSLNEIREKYLSFFEGKNHLRIPSYPLIPDNDKSLLLISSGMAPLKPFFTGQEIPPNKRIVTCQKCVRTVDIEDVGRDARHLAFFQMLGNFSFGDYFKDETIPWAWEFLTEVMDFPTEHLYVSVYEEDDEAYDIWKNKIGLEDSRIFKLGKNDNFWEIGTGPCGPNSEIFFDRGCEYSCGSKCGIGSCDCDRYMEIWNLVFTQFDKTTDGNYEKLSAKSIDTGMGLERMAMVMQRVDSVFEIDTIVKVKTRVQEMTGNTEKNNMSVNIIAEHVRCIVFMAADGILPSNEGRGYILRRLLRRAVRHAKLLGQNEPFIAKLCPVIVDENGKSYPELTEKYDHILQVLTSEEDRFFNTLDTGVAMLEEQCEALKKSGAKVLSGAEAFRLYDTFGFPPELTEEMLAEQGLTYDKDAFEAEMRSQRERARAARSESNYMGADETVFDRLDPSVTTKFVGYDSLTAASTVLALAVGQDLKQEAVKGDEVAIFLNVTPFYAESGGQKGDSGLIKLPNGCVEIYDCKKTGADKTVHFGKVIEGSIKAGDKVQAEVCAESRMSTARNHTATHLLNNALRKVLGSHIEQAGSEVSADRLRFDFTHFSSVSAEELHTIETIVNENIFNGFDVSVNEMQMEEARKAGAVMLMGEKGEKYGDTVRVVSIADGVSTELCGGTHLKNTSQANIFKIVSESSIAAGVRRIEAVTGAVALASYCGAEKTLNEAAASLKTTPDNLINRISSLNTELRQTQRDLDSVKSKLAAGQSSELMENAYEYGGFKWLSVKLSGLDAAGLRTMADSLKDKVDILLLASVADGGPVQFMAHVSKDAIAAGVHAGKMVKEAAIKCGGNGGGRPDNAQAGGKDSAKADEALEAGIAYAKNNLAN